MRRPITTALLIAWTAGSALAACKSGDAPPPAPATNGPDAALPATGVDASATKDATAGTETDASASTDAAAGDGGVTLDAAAGAHLLPTYWGMSIKPEALSDVTTGYAFGAALHAFIPFGAQTNPMTRMTLYSPENDLPKTSEPHVYRLFWAIKYPASVTPPTSGIIRLTRKGDWQNKKTGGAAAEPTATPEVALADNVKVLGGAAAATNAPVCGGAWLSATFQVERQIDDAGTPEVVTENATVFLALGTFTHGVAASTVAPPAGWLTGCP